MFVSCVLLDIDIFSLFHAKFFQSIYLFKYIYAPPWGLSTQAKNFLVTARIMQSSSNELSSLVSGKV